MVEQGTSHQTINVTITGLRFLFETSLARHDALTKMSTVHEPRKLPDILSPEEITKILQATCSIKYKDAFSVAYGAGLRSQEITQLTIADIDSQAMCIRASRKKTA